jgi:hypothetical protein
MSIAQMDDGKQPLFVTSFTRLTLSIEICVPVPAYDGNFYMLRYYFNSTMFSPSPIRFHMVDGVTVSVVARVKYLFRGLNGQPISSPSRGSRRLDVQMFTPWIVSLACERYTGLSLAHDS